MTLVLNRNVPGTFLSIQEWKTLKESTNRLDLVVRIRFQPSTVEDPFKSIVLDDELTARMHQQWKDTIFIKVLGNPWYYHTLCSKLDSLWRLQGNFDLMDLGSGCYCLKNITQEKRDLILTEGPWQLAGNFLSIRKWKPSFDVDNDPLESAITWVRVLNLPVEMFRESVILSIASCIGDPIKIDGNTFSSLCHDCGRVGHTIDDSPEAIRNWGVHSQVNSESPPAGSSQNPIPVMDKHSNKDWLMEKAKKKQFGEWMQVTRRKKEKTDTGTKVAGNKNVATAKTPVEHQKNKTVNRNTNPDKVQNTSGHNNRQGVAQNRPNSPNRRTQPDGEHINQENQSPTPVATQSIPTQFNIGGRILPASITGKKPPVHPKKNNSTVASSSGSRTVSSSGPQ